MTKYDTYVCDTCKKAVDLPSNPSGISALPRCKITKSCAGIMSMIAGTTANGQYHASTSVDVWFQRPQIYDHVQEAPRKVWTVKHNLGANVMVSIMVPNGNGGMVPLHDFDVVSSTDAMSVLEFGGPYTGVALCTARQTSNVTPAAVKAEAPNIPLSINSVMVIATRVRNVSSMELSVQPNPLRPSDIVHVDVEAVPTAQNPWAGATYVIIANQRYVVRFVNIADVLLFHRAAATFFVNAFDGAPVARGDAFVLLSDDPYTHASDRNLTMAVDIADLAFDKQSNTLLTQDALLCTKDAISTIYPTMKAV